MRLSAPLPTPVEPPDTRLRGRGLIAARVVWLVLAAGLFANFLFGIVTYYAQLQTVCLTTLDQCTNWQLLPANMQALHQFGLSVGVYAAAVTCWDVAISLLFLLVGALIFWRKSAEWYGLFVSLLLVSFGCSGLDSSLSFLSAPLPLVLFQLLSLLQWPAVGVFLVTFPTGRFTPRWTWVIALLWLVQLLEFVLPSPYNIADWPTWLVGINHLVVWGSTAAVQLYRYRRSYTPRQRQQTKWMVFGVALGSLVVGLSYILGIMVPGLSAPDSPYQLLNVVFVGLEWMAIILALGVAILQYRLWDIDTIINKALVYGSLTALLAALYAGLIIGLTSLAGFIAGPTATNPLALVISTLAIVALFQPLRQRLQSLIDRRFYRQKYDAEKTLAAFSATLRNEVDLEYLRAQMVAVVQETVQPAYVSLWLRTPEQPAAGLLPSLEARE
ncbi:MAG TPA: hypothetical protein VKT82_00530 [Ktedonobacterales bacterium]|nr:hypothetical protein [Ktedonobacterales bacterium]